MTHRIATDAELRQADAEALQWWLSVITFGIIPRPEREAEAGE